MVSLTPKQNNVLIYIRENGPISVIDIGVHFGNTKKLAERWASPAVRILIKHKKVRKTPDGLFEISK